MTAKEVKYMVVRSKEQNEKCRRPDMPRCELYEAGDFATRYEQHGKT